MRCPPRQSCVAAPSNAHLSPAPFEKKETIPALKRRQRKASMRSRRDGRTFQIRVQSNVSNTLPVAQTSTTTDTCTETISHQPSTSHPMARIVFSTQPYLRHSIYGILLSKRQRSHSILNSQLTRNLVDSSCPLSTITWVASCLPLYWTMIGNSPWAPQDPAVRAT